MCTKDIDLPLASPVGYLAAPQKEVVIFIQQPSRDKHCRQGSNNGQK
jgi:hypothetical protein